MKLVVVFAAFVALCAGESFSPIPGDNSHYVEGVSRYIWMPDGQGLPHLVDLQDDSESDDLMQRNGADNQYWLYTRSNPSTPQFLFNGDMLSVVNSNFDPSKPIKVIAHGWNSNGNSNLNPLITTAFLSVSDCNVIVLDWSRLANRSYWRAARGVPDVGRHLGDFLVWLVDATGASWSNVHLVGHSLGAHLMGNAGRQTGAKPARITGLDPAGPIWGGNDDALKATDAQYVEAIHTDGGFLGIFDPIGAVNFYPNGGRNRQPGCWISTCSHSRAYELFASSVYTNHFVGNQCTDLTQARNNNCSGNQHHMGNAILPKSGNGLFAMTTGRSWPY